MADDVDRVAAGDHFADNQESELERRAGGTHGAWRCGHIMTQFHQVSPVQVTNSTLPIDTET